jgi:hypothetical protein
MDMEDKHSSIDTRLLSVVGATGVAGSTVSRNSLRDSTASEQTDVRSSAVSVKRGPGSILGVSRSSRLDGPVWRHTPILTDSGRLIWRVSDYDSTKSSAMGRDA